MNLSPTRLGIQLSKLWGNDNLPVDVKQVAIEYSRQRYPEEPITKIVPFSEQGFEGGLFKSKGGWVILYNPEATVGRQNFTIAHELGHYLLHREIKVEFQCTQKNISVGYADDENYQQMEREADTFATYLLMPADDLREQTYGREISVELFSACAKRYGTSLLAVILRWIEITEYPALLIVSIDGFILWSSSSKKALKRSVYKRSGEEIPPDSLAAMVSDNTIQTNLDGGLRHEPGVWFSRYGVHEFCVSSDKYDMQISVLKINLNEAPVFDEEDEEGELILPNF